MQILKVAGICISRAEKRSKEEEYMLSNGAKLLQELITSCDGKTKPLRIYSAEELKEATKNYSDEHIYPLCEHDWGCVYYSGIHENRKISIRRPSDDACQIEWLMNEIVVLSQINHKNVPRLLGCCLETRLPTLVYEFLSYNKSLRDYIHDGVISRRPSWEDRLRIAIEVSEALVYLHLATTKTIVHRDVEPRNILLDEHGKSILVDFSLSQSIPEGELHVEGDIVGTFSYIDPEYATSGRFNEKSDVYGFGVVLFELLTGIDPKDVYSSENYTMNQTSDMNEVTLHSLIESHKKNLCPNIEGKAYDQKTAFAELAMRCIQMSSDKRPTMKEVCQELRRMRSSSAPPTT